MIIGKLPFYEKTEVQVLTAVMRGELPTWPSDDAELHINLRDRVLTDKLKDVCFCCWKDKEDRASMSEIMNMLESIQR